MTALEPMPHLTLADVVAAHAEFSPRRVAIVAGLTRTTWRELDANVSRVANGLAASGVGKGDKVAVVMANCPEMIEVLLGIIRAGAVMVPLSLLAAPEALDRMIQDSGAKALFVSPPFHEIIARRMTGPRWVLGQDAVGWTEFRRWRDVQSSERIRVPVAIDDECVIIYSSGTTGTPKGIVHTHGNRSQLATVVAAMFRFTRRSVTLVTTPLYSNGTWLVFLPALLVEAPMVLMGKFDPGLFLELVQRERVTHTFMVPPQFQAILDHPNRAGTDLSSLTMAISAGSALRADLKRRIVSELTTGLSELYGLTEGFSTVLDPEDVLVKPDSVGRPIFGGDVRIIDGEGRELPRGSIGEIAGFGGGLMKGYHQRPEDTAQAVWIGPGGRTFFRSGDIGKMDEDGYLYILDRKKDMILSGGFNVYPRDIEEVAATHPDVLDVTVIGVPDPKWDEVPLALVISRPGRTPDRDDLKRRINDRVGKAQRVARVELVEQFPRNALGKVLTKELRAAYGQ